jgi:hypothetical protein
MANPSTDGSSGFAPVPTNATSYVIDWHVPRVVKNPCGPRVREGTAPVPRYRTAGITEDALSEAVEPRVMTRVRAGTPLGEPPAWATLERDLLECLDDAVEPVLDRYVEDDGTVMWPPADDYTGIDALDDAYESFFDWPLAYLLGADERLLDLGKREFDAITEQFAAYDTGHGHPMVVDEYEQGYDWFHQSEGYVFFYLLCMADPADERFRERARRFADLYLNDADAPDLYDEEHRLLKAPMLGSKGPAHRNFSGETPPPQYHSHAESRIPWSYEEWKEAYGLPFYDIEEIDTVADLRDEAKARRMGEALRDRCAHGDVPQNLAATTMAVNAYLLSGEARYREWALEYTEAWIERTEENGGLLPDNVDLEGEIGGNLDGKWYGGYYGWTWPHGWRSMGSGPTVAAENAALLTGDPSYLEWPRSQIERLADLGIEHDGELHVPYKHADPATLDYGTGWNTGDALHDGEGNVYQDEGWFEFRPSDGMNDSYVGHVWHALLDEGSEALIEALDGPLDADREYHVGGGGKAKAGNDVAWIAYLRGALPDYPERILRDNRRIVTERLAFCREDDQDPATYGDAYLQQRNPVVTEGLVHCTMGAPHLVYHGGLQGGRVRHFDPARERPGLPRDVAALVTGLETDRTTLVLVNLGATERTVAVQAGAFAQHAFGRVTYEVRSDGAREKRAVDVDDDVLEVTLPGGTRTTLDAETRRFANDPTYAFPWDR